MARVRVLRGLAFLGAAWLAGAAGHGQVTADPGPRVLERLAAWVDPRVRAIDREVGGIGGELERLPDWRSYGQTQRLGYQSLSTRKDAPRWVQVDLGSVRRVDRVVAVPVQMAFTRHLGPFGMPIRFRVEVSEDPDFGASAAAVEFPVGSDYPDGIPAVIDAGGRSGRYVRLTATKLWQAGDTVLFALAELMIISGNRNVALNLPVERLTACDSLEQPPTWSLANLVDGHSIVGAPLWRAGGESVGCLARPVSAWERAWVAVDLGREFDLEEVRLIPIRPDVLRREMGPRIGLPNRLMLELAPAADSPEWRKIEVPDDLLSINPGRCPVVVDASGRHVRHVRVTHRGPLGGPLPLAEIQVYAGGTNVALGGAVRTSRSLEAPPRWGAGCLVDGQAYGCRLCEWPEFLDGIVRLGVLQMRLLALRGEREAHIAEGVSVIRGFGSGAVLLMLVVAAVVWRMVHERRRQLSALRDSILRDMHDEVGSGLGAIGLLSEFAREGSGDTRADMAEINRLSQELNESLRNLAWLSGSGGETVADLAQRLERTVSVYLPGVRSRIETRGDALGRGLSLAVRREILLVAKEAMHNIGRHAGAREVTVSIAAERQRLRLEVGDDGCGFDVACRGSGTGLRSMRERAARLGGRFEIESGAGAGTRVAVEIPLPRAGNLGG